VIDLRNHPQTATMMFTSRAAAIVFVATAAFATLMVGVADAQADNAQVSPPSYLQ